MKKPQNIDHIGLAVKNLDQAIETYKLLGLEVSHIEEVSGMGVRVAFIQIGESRFELLQPLNDQSPVAKFISKRGEGVHHICLKVEDIKASLAALKEKNFNLIYEEPRKGAENSLVSFIHPKSTHGVLLELCQKQ